MDGLGELEMKTEQVIVSKEVHEIAVEARAFVGDIRQALADGWDPATDSAAIAVSAMTHAVTALNGSSKVVAEFRDSPRAATMGIVVELVPAIFEAFGK
jgi:hypothetical protein